MATRASWISEWNNFNNLILCVNVMPPIKFQLNRTWGLGGDVLENFKMATMVAILDIGTE